MERKNFIPALIGRSVFIAAFFAVLMALPGSVRAAPILINNASVDNFDGLTASQINAAKALRSMLRHASVGGLISDGLDKLQIANSKYDRTNFSFQARGNPSWQDKLDDFTDQVADQQASFDVFGMKLCYIDQNAEADTYIDEMNAMEAAHPTKVFVWWTEPTETNTNLALHAAFNDAVRAYAAAHDKILFDIAAIESHHANGSACTSGGKEDLCSEYSLDGGHPNQVGSERLAKAYWVLMTSIASDGSSDAVDPVAPPAVDPTITGAYTSSAALANNPDINTNMGLSAKNQELISISSCVSGTLIKASLPAVYYCGADGKRYVFASDRVFFSWYNGFSGVQTIDDVDLAKIPLGGNVTYRPGKKMIKIQSDPKVYAVARRGVLRWVSTETKASELFGANWNQQIDDVSDAFFVNYTVGTPI
jgi:hypothetical protein